VVAEHQQPRSADAQIARGVAAVPSNDRLAPGFVLEDELIYQSGIARQRIAGKILPDAQLHAENFSGSGKKGGRLDPHVVGQDRGGSQQNE